MTEPPTSGAAPDNPGVIAHPPLLYAGSLAAGAILEQIVPLPMLPPGAGLVPGVALVALGLGLAGWCLALFRRSGTNAPPHMPATALVTGGPYGFSRNPMYLGMTLLALGVAVWVNSFWMLGLLAPTLVIMNVGVVAREERYLAAKFGDEYRAYMKRVRRWL